MKKVENRTKMLKPLTVSIGILLVIVLFLFLLVVDDKVRRHPRSIEDIAPYTNDTNEPYKDFENLQMKFSKLELEGSKTIKFREQWLAGNISNTTIRDDTPSIERTYDKVEGLMFLVKDLNQYSEIITYYPSVIIDWDENNLKPKYPLKSLTWAVGDFAIAVPSFDKRRESVLDNFIEVHQLTALYSSSLRRIDDLVGLMDLLYDHYVIMDMLRSKLSKEQRVKLVNILSNTPSSKELITKTIWCWFVAVQTSFDNDKLLYSTPKTIFVLNENFSFNQLGDFLNEQIRFGESGDWNLMENHQKTFDQLSGEFHIKNYRGWKFLNYNTQHNFTEEYQWAHELDQIKADLIKQLMQENN